MSFWGFIGLLVILGIMAAALYMSKLATEKEQEIQNKRQQIRHIRTEIGDIDEIMHTLLIYDRQPELLFAFINRMETLINDGLRLLPDDDNLKKDYEDLAKLNEQTNELNNNPVEPETPSSDRQIFLLKKHFIRTVKMLKELHANGMLTEMELNTHRSRLLKNSLMLEVNAYRKQAKEARNQGDLSSAGNFYKHAKELLVNSEINFADKTAQIKAVSREISGLYVTVPNAEESTEKKATD